MITTEYGIEFKAIFLSITIDKEMKRVLERQSKRIVHTHSFNIQ